MQYTVHKITVHIHFVSWRMREKTEFFFLVLEYWKVKSFPPILLNDEKAAFLSFLRTYDSMFEMAAVLVIRWKK